MNHYAELHFDPQPDITAYEIARVMEFIFTKCSFGFPTGIPFPVKAMTVDDLAALEKLLNEQYPLAQRHFSIVCVHDGDD